MKNKDCRFLKCFSRLCAGNDRCPVREYNLARIKTACIKTALNPKSEKEKFKGKWPDVHVAPPILLQPSGWIGMRKVVYEFSGVEPRQALEILSNGDCATNR